MGGNEHISSGVPLGRADVISGREGAVYGCPRIDFPGRCMIRPADVQKDWGSLGRTCDSMARAIASDSNACFIRISTILNELLERTVDRVVPSSTIGVEIRRHENRIAISITGETTRKAWIDLKKDYGDLYRADLDTVYREKLRDSVLTRKLSGLDLVMLKKDFLADITISATEDLDDRIWMTINADVAL